MAGKPKRDTPAPTQARKGSAYIHRTCKLITLILSIYIQNTKLKFDFFFKRKKDERERSRGETPESASFLPPTEVGSGFPGGSDGKESACNAEDLGSILGLGRSPGEGNGNPLPVFLPGESHGQRSLEGSSPRCHKESDTVERLTLSLHSLQKQDQKMGMSVNGFVLSNLLKVGGALSSLLSNNSAG